MKTLCKFILVLMLVTNTLPSSAKTFKSRPAKSVTPEKLDAVEMQKLVNRLEEIKSMDMKSLTKQQRRELRGEVKQTQKKIASSGGVYLSVTALLIIIILIILL